LKAIVKYAVGDGCIGLRDVPEPQVGPGQVKIKVEAAGICGSDLHIWHGDIMIPVRPPVVLGHEFSGIIVAVGPGVTRWREGQRVTAENSYHVCGECDYCMTGNYNLCEQRLATGYAFDGAFAPYCVVPQERVHLLPDSVDFVTGALSDPSACAYRAVCEKARVQAGDTVLITGPGPMGLFCTQYAKANGGLVILVGMEPDRARLRLGKEMGADHVLDASTDNVEERVAQLTSRKGVDIVLECSGAAPAANQALRLLRKTGRFTQVGIFGKPLVFDLDQVLYKEIELNAIFSHKYMAWEKAIALAGQGRIVARPLVTDILPLSQWEQGFRRFETKEALKVIFEPQRAF
jgi:L-iditol 2-dehydrogenase